MRRSNRHVPSVRDETGFFGKLIHIAG